jgi:hypothetical protein
MGPTPARRPELPDEDRLRHGGRSYRMRTDSGTEAGATGTEARLYFTLPYASSSRTTSSNSGVEASSTSQSVMAIMRCFTSGRTW